jgi:hypothetical protein
MQWIELFTAGVCFVIKSNYMSQKSPHHFSPSSSSRRKTRWPKNKKLSKCRRCAQGSTKVILANIWTLFSSRILVVFFQCQIFFFKVLLYCHEIFVWTGHSNPRYVNFLSGIPRYTHGDFPCSAVFLPRFSNWQSSCSLFAAPYLFVILYA